MMMIVRMMMMMMTGLRGIHTSPISPHNYSVTLSLSFARS
jgi:hypothetical protein